MKLKMTLLKWKEKTVEERLEYLRFNVFMDMLWDFVVIMLVIAVILKIM